MEQYLNLLREIKQKGTHKPSARENMPSTLSLFGTQFRHNLQDGFPLLTTKKLSFKNIVVELLWFLRGDTNIKYLVDNGCNIWNEDAYNYYRKIHSMEFIMGGPDPMEFDEFIQKIKENNLSEYYPHFSFPYKLGDCGYQYGKLWRAWDNIEVKERLSWADGLRREVKESTIDQIKNLIDGLKKNPMGRRHIITAWNPATLDKMALNACHALVQFNCRPLSFEERRDLYYDKYEKALEGVLNYDLMESVNIPKYYLDCQMYQRSADVFLGVPYNIASYALLTEILCKICNMVAGDFIHTFGDVHIYEDHMDAVNEQLSRELRELPKLVMTNFIWEKFGDGFDFTGFIPNDFRIKDYNPHPAIKAKLSTGLK